MAVFRVERTRDYTVMSNHHLKNRLLSLKAKGLLSVMLSLPDEWDYTLRGLSAISKEGVDAIREAIRELEDAGYIVRSRGRNEKGQLSGTEYVIYEHPQQSADAPVLDIPTQEKSVVADKPKEELKAAKPLDFNEPKRESQSIKSLDFSTSKAIYGSCETSNSSGKTPMWENPTLDHPTLEKPTLENPTLENPTQLNTKRSKTNSERKQQTNSSIPLSIPSPSLPAQTEGGMEEDQVRKYRNQVKRNIDYFEISEDYAANLEQLDEIVDLMVETLCSTRPTLSVAGDNLPASLVKERLLKINCMHIQYVMDSLKSNTTPVRNIKRYLLTVLFNAPATIDHYYSAQFRHEYYQQAQRNRAEG